MVSKSMRKYPKSSREESTRPTAKRMKKRELITKMPGNISYKNYRGQRHDKSGGLDGYQTAT